MQRTHQDFQVGVVPSPRARAALRLTVRRARALWAPEPLLLGAVLVLGWAALIAWTGNGAVGWQARLCADAEASLPACRVAAPITDGKVL
ncbi:hypothetical protein [Methylobacterium sp. J-068]|uniref:hypothetical protein n=1 Tax=Methylobacterium sp. J-068 TaxID=2836649 RepID=UPI001FB8D480|nr:hypothetical protein [Methylobacterium sp. J-068]MCJ2033409.1 hypothetical protein [Methylobacterium sp. J-068]